MRRFEVDLEDGTGYVIEVDEKTGAIYLEHWHSCGKCMVSEGRIHLS